MRPVPTWIRLIRWFLAAVYLVYGVIKLAGGQFFHGDFVIDSRTVDGPFFVWAFFGWSKPYSIFAGLGEAIPAALLLFNRTATLGAVLLFPVVVNITVMTFAFGFPSVKFVSLVYTILVGILLLHDLPRLLPAVFPDPAPPVQPFSRLGKAAVAAIGLPLLFVTVTVLSESLSPGPDAAARAALAGRGIAADSLTLRRWRLGGQLFNRSGFVELTTADSSRTWRIEVSRPISFVAWRVGRIEEGPR